MKVLEPLRLLLSRVLVDAFFHFPWSMRQYTFAALLWFVSPLAFSLGTAGIVFVLYRREFHSDVLAVLRHRCCAPACSTRTRSGATRRSRRA